MHTVFVVLCFVVVMQSFIMNSHEAFIHIHQGCFAGTGAIVRLPQCQWSKPDGYGIISQCITTTKHSKAKTVCIFLGTYCISIGNIRGKIDIHESFAWMVVRWFADRFPRWYAPYGQCEITSIISEIHKVRSRYHLVCLSLDIDKVGFQTWASLISCIFTVVSNWQCMNTLTHWGQKLQTICWQNFLLQFLQWKLVHF